MSPTNTHIGFADESHWNIGRFRSLGLVTLSAESLEMLDDELRGRLSTSNVREFKWNGLNGAKERFAAEGLCEFAVNKACAALIRIDVLVWDIEDTRNKVIQRDDIANLQRMYYHLFRDVLRARWPNNGVWRLCPDEHTALQWETTHDCLENASTSVEVDRSLFSGGAFRLRLRREFGMEEIRPVRSHEHPLLQLADLFAGLGVFSREKYEEYQAWVVQNSPQLRLFDEGGLPPISSGITQERFPVLAKLDGMCKRRRLGVSLKTSHGLWTPKPDNPLNFWLYQPQHEMDKAPQKGQR